MKKAKRPFSLFKTLKDRVPCTKKTTWFIRLRKNKESDKGL